MYNSTYGQGTYTVPGSSAPANVQQQQSSVAKGAYAPVQIGQQGSAPVSQVVAPNDPQAYFNAVQQSFAPQFQQSQQQLNAQQEAMGTLTSGAGNYADQQLTAQNNATLAGAEAPLIQQGFAQQYGANTANANAQNTANLNTQAINAAANTQNANSTNSYLGDLQNQYFQAGQNQINNNLQGQEFNANLLSGIYTNDMNAQNALQMAKLGYGNSNYQQQVGIDAGLESQGLGGALGTTAAGQFAQNANYIGTQNMNNPYMQSIGAASQIPSSFTGSLSVPNQDLSVLNPGQYGPTFSPTPSTTDYGGSFTSSNGYGY